MSRRRPHAEAAFRADAEHQCLGLPRQSNLLSPQMARKITAAKTRSHGGMNLQRLHRLHFATVRPPWISLPYEIEPLYLDAPLAPTPRHRPRARWIDWNGHMNVGYYVVAFDKATDTLCQQFGCGLEYTRDKIGMTFVLEAHVTYDQRGQGRRSASRHHPDPRSRCQTACTTSTCHVPRAPTAI